MSRLIGTLALVAFCVASPARATDWHLGPITLIDSNGTRPSLWAGTVAYLDGDGGALMYYDGATSMHVYGPNQQSWEPANANGSVGWRNLVGSDSWTNEIYRWNGQLPVFAQNVSNSPGVTDTDVSAGANGDLIWSRDHTSLMYYDASSDTTSPLNIDGEYPSLYITAGGVATYAWQDAATDEVKYFDGVTTHTLGAGSSTGANPSLWDGAVAWIGAGQGSTFLRGEVFYWRNGQTQRITNDDAAGGIADVDPWVWKAIVIWTRRVNGPFEPPVLYLWDGADRTPLTTSGGQFPSVHDGHVAWQDDDGVHLAAVVGPGDCDENGRVDLIDYADFEACLTGPGGPLPPECECFDLNESGQVGLDDFAPFQEAYTGS